MGGARTRDIGHVPPREMRGIGDEIGPGGIGRVRVVVMGGGEGSGRGSVHTMMKQTPVYIFSGTVSGAIHGTLTSTVNAQ